MDPRQLLEHLRVVAQDLQTRMTVAERIITSLRQAIVLEQQKTIVLQQEIEVLKQKLTESDGGEVGPVSGW